MCLFLKVKPPDHFNRAVKKGLNRCEVNTRKDSNKETHGLGPKTSPVKVPPRRKRAAEPPRNPREEPSGPSQIRISSLEHGRESETNEPQSDD